MPDSINELMWWGLNGAILIVAFYIRGDLKEIKDSLKERRAGHDDHEKRIVRLEVRCKLMTCEDTPHIHMREDDLVG
jgi:hypothetical protein